MNARELRDALYRASGPNLPVLIEQEDTGKVHEIELLDYFKKVVVIRVKKEPANI